MTSRFSFAVFGSRKTGKSTSYSNTTCILIRIWISEGYCNLSWVGKGNSELEKLNVFLLHFVFKNIAKEGFL